MAYMIDNRTQGLNIAGYFRNFSQRYADWRVAREAYLRTYRELSSLTDRELSDIGISRAQIEDIARQSAHQA